MSGGLLHMQARVQAPYAPDELRAMSGDDLLHALLHEEHWVVGGANHRGEIVTEETTARRDQLRGEISRRLKLIDVNPPTRADLDQIFEILLRHENQITVLQQNREPE